MHGGYEDGRAVNSNSMAQYGGSSTSSKGRVRKGLLGLTNLGNTCFMNSVLQCLSHTHGMQKYFRLCSHDYSAKGPSSRQRLLMSFAHWFERDWGTDVSALYHSPEDILRCVQQLNPIFQGYSQQDAQEFLRCVLDNMHEELRREVPDVAGLSFSGLRPRIEVGTSSSSASLPGPEGSNGASARPASASPSGSAARQLMQLCQTAEVDTDAGEIRLPTVRQAPGTGSETRTGSSDRGAPNATPNGEDTSSAASSSSGGQYSSPNGCAANASPTCSPIAPCGTGKATARTPRERQLGQDDENTAMSDAPRAIEKKPSEAGQQRPHYASIISELFEGHVVSAVRCLECQRTSRTTEPLYDVSVQIPNPSELSSSAPDLEREVSGRNLGFTNMLSSVAGKVKGLIYDKGVDITDCLRKFCAPEYLVGKEKYECEHCKRKTDGERRLVFKELPEVLCIHIKRFRYDSSWFNAQKNSRVVTFPVTKHLDMSPFLDEPPPHSVEYRLVGLIQHIGSMGGGHYVSYCQHKRKTQEWFEFDDLQVRAVSADVVEKAEPYVLFYQRLPSKAARAERQNFKTDRKKTEATIRDYLLSLPDPPPEKMIGNADGRNLGPALQKLYRNPPTCLDVVFVSKRWYVRLACMSEPGPIDNYEYICPHGLLGSAVLEAALEPFMPISRSRYEVLIATYGGGPMIRALDICPQCQRHLQVFNDRKQTEYELVTKYDTKTTGEGHGWYLVDAVWVNKWKRYVRSDPITEIHDISATAPGPVNNGRLLDKHGEPRSGLKLRIDYIGVNARVWWLFMHVHGGGPALCRQELDLYSEGHRLETELMLEELKLNGPHHHVARATSWEFVEQCKGDIEMFEQQYGRGRASPVATPSSPVEAFQS
mmetsp:Transcript_34467/g.73426  ORF Transcript_34467/g.73426 Transcript_34467/m.73426 type:complete len:880 (-) Transcript_34467:214-2853(-)